MTEIGLVVADAPGAPVSFYWASGAAQKTRIAVRDEAGGGAAYTYQLTHQLHGDRRSVRAQRHHGHGRVGPGRRADVRVPLRWRSATTPRGRPTTTITGSRHSPAPMAIRLYDVPSNLAARVFVFRADGSEVARVSSGVRGGALILNPPAVVTAEEFIVRVSLWDVAPAEVGRGHRAARQLHAGLQAFGLTALDRGPRSFPHFWRFRAPAMSQRSAARTPPLRDGFRHAAARGTGHRSRRWRWSCVPGARGVLSRHPGRRRWPAAPGRPGWRPRRGRCQRRDGRHGRDRRGRHDDRRGRHDNRRGRQRGLGGGRGLGGRRRAWRRRGGDGKKTGAAARPGRVLRGRAGAAARQERGRRAPADAVVRPGRVLRGPAGAVAWRAARRAARADAAARRALRPRCCSRTTSRLDRRHHHAGGLDPQRRQQRRLDDRGRRQPGVAAKRGDQLDAAHGAHERRQRRAMDGRCQRLGARERRSPPAAAAPRWRSSASARQT